MRLLLAVLAVALVLPSAALGQAPDLRAPDQQAPAPTARPAPMPDLRAPDQQAPAAPSTPVVDRRAPDQQAPATPAAAQPVTATDGGPGALVFVLIGLAAALVMGLGGFMAVRHRHAGVPDDLVTP